MDTQDGFSEEEWRMLAQRFGESPTALSESLPRDSRWERLRVHALTLQGKGSKKFSDAERWLWTTKLLEQASDERVASLAASFFPQHASILDICCGAGADTVFLSQRGSVKAVDRSAIACELARANLKRHFPGETMRHAVVCRDAEQVEIASDHWVHLDPDRRGSGERTIQPERFEPSLPFLAQAIHRSAGGSIKLAPATPAAAVEETDRLLDGLDHRVREGTSRPSRLGIQFVAWGRTVRQQRWWWNCAAFPASTVTASLLDRSGQWHHWTVDRNESLSSSEWPTITLDEKAIGRYVGDADGCLRAAGMQPKLAHALSARMIGSEQGFLHSDRIDNNERLQPFIDWFSIDTILPLDRKRLRALLRERKIGRLEIKVRQASVSPEALRQELKLSGDQSATLLITRCGSRTLALVATRIATHSPLPDAGFG